jgi:hypothetical protein
MVTLETMKSANIPFRRKHVGIERAVNLLLRRSGLRLAPVSAGKQLAEFRAA